MALGKSLGEIRALPYPEFKSWATFYELEPWGWHNEEYLTAAVVSTIYNVNAKKGKGKSPAKFIRDIPKLLLRYLKQERMKQDTLEIDLDTPEGRKAATEQIVRNIKKTFGKGVKDKRRKK